MKDPIIEKLYNTIREMLIHQHGDEFLELTEREQDLLIGTTFAEFVEHQKKNRIES
jgi:hypothetical protein